VSRHQYSRSELLWPQRDYEGSDTIAPLNAEDLLRNSRTCKAAIQREIAMTMLDRICIDGDPTTFLPKQIVALMQSVISPEERPEYER